MSIQKEKPYPVVSINLSSENPGEYTVAETDENLKVALEKKRKEASKPLYLKRI